MNDSVQLTKKLTGISSYVDADTDESTCGQYIFKWLSDNTKLQVAKQKVTNNRFNVIASNTDKPKLLIVAHIDTVAPKSTQQLRPQIKSGKLFGLGASDMKSTVAAIMTAAKNVTSPLPYWLLFYVDEEYDFLGTKAFIRKYRDKINPQLIIGEGNNNQVINGCRGLIEITYDIKGQTGHAARPESGINALMVNYQIIKEISAYVQTFQQTMQSTLNVASINGGLLQNKPTDKLLLSRQGNSIADYCQTVIDIRPGSKQLTTNKIISRVELSAKKLNTDLANYTIRHDLPPWYTPAKELEYLGINTTTNFADPNKTGYLDIQMFNQAFQCPCMGYGAGLASQAHQPNEYVPLKNIHQAEKFFEQLLSTPLKG